MITAFSIATAGLRTTSRAIDTVAQNLANLNTTGYRATVSSFNEVFYQTVGADGSNAQLSSGGVTIGGYRDFRQGSLVESTSALSAGITGEGFFVLRDSLNQTLLTRAGDFVIDASGMLRTRNGEPVQGWSAINGVINTNAPLSDIVIPPTDYVGATPTTQFSVTANLDARALVGSPQGTYTTPIQVVDSLGEVHTLSITYTKTGANTWGYTVTIPGADLQNPAPPQETLATGTLQFDATTGRLLNGAAVPINIPALANGATAQLITWNQVSNGVGLLTHLATTSNIANLNQDGFRAGSLVNISMADGGVILARYTNGESRAVAQLGLALVSNPETMTALSNSYFLPTNLTSDPRFGAAATGGRGNVAGGVLEQSNVELTKEFTNLITYQRSYQANSRVITTSDEILQETVNLKR